jgi:hypothetical protein
MADIKKIAASKTADGKSIRKKKPAYVPYKYKPRYPSSLGTTRRCDMDTWESSITLYDLGFE